MTTIKSEEAEDTVLLGKDSPAPFNSNSGDIIIKASDNVHFRAHRTILALASSVFSDMLSLPESPPENRLPEDYIGDIPCVPVTEDSRTIDLLLRFLYPMEDPSLDAVEDFRVVLAAATKYQMDFLCNKLRELWLSVLKQDSFRAFAAACRMAWEEEARVAARYTLEESIWPLEPPLPAEFKHVSADAIIRLNYYHKKCADTATHIASKHDWLIRAMDEHKCDVCGKSYSGSSQSMKTSDWLDEYMRRIIPLLQINPSARTVHANPHLVEASIKHIFQSEGTCDLQVHIRKKIDHTVDLFAREIENVVSKVPLDLGF